MPVCCVAQCECVFCGSVCVLILVHIRNTQTYTPIWWIYFQFMFVRVDVDSIRVYWHNYWCTYLFIPVFSTYLSTCTSYIYVPTPTYLYTPNLPISTHLFIPVLSTYLSICASHIYVLTSTFSHLRIYIHLIYLYLPIYSYLSYLPICLYVHLTSMFSHLCSHIYASIYT